VKRVKITSHRAHESGFFEDMLYIHSQIVVHQILMSQGKDKMTSSWVVYYMWGLLGDVQGSM
jgi:hypothetical protein